MEIIKWTELQNAEPIDFSNGCDCSSIYSNKVAADNRGWNTNFYNTNYYGYGYNNWDGYNGYNSWTYGYGYGYPNWNYYYGYNDYNYNYNNSPRSYSDSYRENYEPDKENEKYLESESSSKSKGNFQYGNLEASYEIDTLRLLTVAFGMYGSSDKSTVTEIRLCTELTDRILRTVIEPTIMEKGHGILSTEIQTINVLPEKIKNG